MNTQSSENQLALLDRLMISGLVTEERRARRSLMSHHLQDEQCLLGSVHGGKCVFRWHGYMDDTQAGEKLRNQMKR